MAILITIFLQICFPGVLCGAAPGVGNIGDNVVGVFEHPVVAPRDSIVRGQQQSLPAAWCQKGRHIWFAY